MVQWPFDVLSCKNNAGYEILTTKARFIKRKCNDCRIAKT